MPMMMIFGLGYTGKHLAARLRADGWDVVSTGRDGSLRFDDAASVRLALADATHILSTVPPVADGDPVLNAYARDMKAPWIGYLSSTGVYGDAGGAWVDEHAPIKGRRITRNDADADWQARGAYVFRLPGIYGPGRSALDRAQEGKAHRIADPAQVFSRVHVEDIVAAILASFSAPAGVYNIADDLPASQNQVIELACDLCRLPYPPVQSLDEATLSPAARAFYAENRRVSNVKAKRLLGWTPLFPTYVEGLRALNATTKPVSATMLPTTASVDQR